ncbi:binder of sperm protein homolog 1-like [Rhynchonycteris naso]
MAASSPCGSPAPKMCKVGQDGSIHTDPVPKAAQPRPARLRSTWQKHGGASGTRALLSELLFFLGGKCIFPFYYKTGIFYDCVKFKAKHRWCSLNKTYQGYWKYCAEEDFAKCVFPFWHRRMIYWECTEDSDAFGRKWCSLTRNYNKDKVWKYCD